MSAGIERASAARRGLAQLAGALVLGALGLVFVIEGDRYGLGELRRMGPGYVPALLGWIMLGLAVLIALSAPGGRSAESGGEETVARRPLLCVSAGVMAFVLLLPLLGLLPAVFLCALLSAFAERAVRWRSAVLVGLTAAAVAWAVFVGVLGLALPLVELPL